MASFGSVGSQISRPFFEPDEGASVQPSKRSDRQKVIDENLKRVFDETLEEGIPDRFKDLLSQLKQLDGQKDNPK